MLPEPTRGNSDSGAEATVKTALEQGLAEIQTPAQAEQALVQLERAAEEIAEGDLPTDQNVAAADQAERIAAAADETPGDQRTVAVLTEAAAQIATAPAENREMLDDAVAQAVGPTDAFTPEGGAPPPQRVIRARRLLRRALIKRLRPFDAVDSMLFLSINHLPHTRGVDRAMSRFSWAMTGGAGWMIVLLVHLIRDRREGWRAVREIAPPLWLATVAVEYPIKYFFRRRRPFLAIVRAIIVGRKPASYSFPSGHSAAAFAGATLLARRYPRGAAAFYLVAALVGFSRVYLGAHYPGDVLTGAASGASLARVFSRLLGGRR
ncbi:MAG TPA: phosphatase PAP2 family protein [Chthoniobacteraceae bacterium]|jgi:undecaprenyl-diphosphatase